MPVYNVWVELKFEGKNYEGEMPILASSYGEARALAVFRTNPFRDDLNKQEVKEARSDLPELWESDVTGSDLYEHKCHEFVRQAIKEGVLKLDGED